MERVTAYLCCNKMAAIEETIYDADVVSVGDGIVNTKIIQEGAGCSPDSVLLKTKIIITGFSKYCNLEEGIISMKESRVLQNTLEVTYNFPGHCHWKAAVLWVNGSNRTAWPLSFPRNLIQITEPVGGGACPESKEDVFGGPGTSQALIKAYWDDSDPESSNQDVVPGDRLNITWFMWDGGKEESIYVAHLYFSTQRLTGGLVTAVNGDYGSADITYTVDAEGVSITCVSSDFVEYAVDDWVIVQKLGNIILPLKIGSFTN